MHYTAFCVMDITGIGHIYQYIVQICVCVRMMWCCVMLLLAPVFATMQQVNIVVISLSSCKHYDSLKSHISLTGLGATFVIIV